MRIPRARYWEERKREFTKLSHLHSVSQKVDIFSKMFVTDPTEHQLMLLKELQNFSLGQWTDAVRMRRA